MILRVELKNIGPIDGRTDAGQFREVWEEAVALFADKPAQVQPDAASSHAWSISLDASDAITYLRAAEQVEIDPEPFRERLASQRAAGRHMTSSELHLSLSGPTNGSESDRLRAAGKFLQHLFLAMNAALPGCCRIGGSYLDDPEDSLPPPDVSGNSLESAFVHAQERGWPNLRRLPFSECWSWMEAELPYHLETATEPHHRALLTLLRLCGEGVAETDTMLQVAQVLEAFFSDGRQGIGAILRTRLELVLGEPPTHQKWFNKFYAQHSRIAHGSAPILRPGWYAQDDHPEVLDYLDSYFVPLDEALAVLMAIVQDLVLHRSHRYAFCRRH